MPSSPLAALQARERPSITVANGTPRSRVRLRVEEDLRVPHVVGRCAREVGERHVLEVLLLDQHRGAGVIDVEEALQIGEGVGRAQCLDVRVGQRDVVALGQREDQLRFERAFDMNVQFRLRHRLHQRRKAIARDTGGVERK